MTIKEARKMAGLTQAGMSIHLGIPKRTIEDWENDRRTPSDWVEKLVIEKLQNLNKSEFHINSDSVKNYAEICKRFSNDTSEWGGLDDYKFYTTDGAGWEETSDNAHGGVDVSWAFQLSDGEIEMRAAEELLEQLMNELDLADSDGWGSDSFRKIYEKFDFSQYQISEYKKVLNPVPGENCKYVIETRPSLGDTREFNRAYDELENGEKFYYVEGKQHTVAIKINDKYAAMVNYYGNYIIAQRYKNCLSIGSRPCKEFKSFDAASKYAESNPQIK